jgi:hypothetical protein
MFIPGIYIYIYIPSGRERDIGFFDDVAVSNGRYVLG